MFISFTASALRFTYCRPVLGLDGTHLKHRYQCLNIYSLIRILGTLLAAAAIAAVFGCIVLLLGAGVIFYVIIISIRRTDARIIWEHVGAECTPHCAKCGVHPRRAKTPVIGIKMSQNGRNASGRGV